MKLQLLRPDHPMLYRPTAAFNFNEPTIDPILLATEMIDFMRSKKGIGLSANQVGIPFRVFVMEGDPAFAMFNPKIVDVATEEVELMEGCLTRPDLWLKIHRPEWVRVRFQTPYGETTTKVFGGYHARCILHEVDHLDGKCYTWKSKPRDLEKARKIQKKHQQGKLRYVENQG
jgi:peptide deformylase